MSSVRTDQELKRALQNLSPSQQLRLGALFLEAVADLYADSRVRRALEVALNPDSSAQECDEAYRSVRAFAIESYTECGRDTDWSRQAEHFAASAAACLLAGDDTAGSANRAWKAAMQLRNARNCARIAQVAIDHDEAERQYRIANAFLDSISKDAIASE